MKKRTKLILVCAGLPILGIAGWHCGALYLSERAGYYRYHGGRLRLFHETDYYALREECMTVIANRHSYLRLEQVGDVWHWRRGTDAEGAGSTGPIIVKPDDPSLPPILLEFGLSALVVTECRLAAHPYHGPPSCSHYGFVVFLDEDNITDISGPPEEIDLLIGVSSVDRDLLLVPNDKVWVKIIDNLWFFDADSFPSGGPGPSRDEVIRIFRKQVAEQEGMRTRE